MVNTVLPKFPSCEALKNKLVFNLQLAGLANKTLSPTANLKIILFQSS